MSADSFAVWSFAVVDKGGSTAIWTGLAQAIDVDRVTEAWHEINVGELNVGFEPDACEGWRVKELGRWIM